MMKKIYKTLFRKRLAFRQVFNDQDPAVKVVLAELKKICPSNPTLGAGAPIDERQVFINIGRRQVLGHIMALIYMSDEKLNQIAREEEEYVG